jgi:hypothetical protein
MKIHDTISLKIRTTDILLVSSKSFLAKTIQGFQSIQNQEYGQWNHAGLFVEISEQLFVSEAIKSGIALTKFKEYTDSNKSLMLLRPKCDVFFKMDESFFKDCVNELTAFIMPYHGRDKYGFFNLLFLQPLKMITNKWYGQNEKEMNYRADNMKLRFICGQWVAYVYYEIFGVFKNWYKLAPVDLCISNNFEHYLYLCADNKKEGYSLFAKID